jgi:hypothetical protein
MKFGDQGNSAVILDAAGNDIAHAVVHRATPTLSVAQAAPRIEARQMNNHERPVFQVIDGGLV